MRKRWTAAVGQIEAELSLALQIGLLLDGTSPPSSPQSAPSTLVLFNDFASVVVSRIASAQARVETFSANVDQSAF